jgi:D-tyrosyl-tRNA(Tyr) deacylase
VFAVSQFTLYGTTKKGNKPDFHHAMPGEAAQKLYEEFLLELRAGYSPEKVKGKGGSVVRCGCCRVLAYGAPLHPHQVPRLYGPAYRGSTTLSTHSSSIDPRVNKAHQISTH